MRTADLGRITDLPVWIGVPVMMRPDVTFLRFVSCVFSFFLPLDANEVRKKIGCAYVSYNRRCVCCCDETRMRSCEGSRVHALHQITYEVPWRRQPADDNTAFVLKVLKCA